MTQSTPWHDILEPDEELLWTGRPRPRLHWRNWRLFGPAPMAAVGLLAAAGFIVLTYGIHRELWLMAATGILVLIPARTTLKQLRTYAATRYALTNRRAIFFHIGPEQTTARAFPRAAMIAPRTRNTLPKSINFIRQGSENTSQIGFDYIEESQALMPHLTAAQEGGCA